MKRTFLHKLNGRTTRHDTQRREVLFFAYPHFLFFNFTAAAHLAHLVLPNTPANASQNQKSQIIQRHMKQNSQVNQS